MSEPPPHLRGVALPPDVDVARLRSRYGADHSRIGVILVAAAVVVPFLGWVVWAGVQHADPELRWETIGFEDASDTSVQVNFDVFLPTGSSAECTVRALSVQGIEVGRAQVPVEAQGGSATVVYALAVTGRPSSAFVETCRLTDQP
jgi:hypothetical protein